MITIVKRQSNDKQATIKRQSNDNNITKITKKQVIIHTLSARVRKIFFPRLSGMNLGEKQSE